jgi:hypothetical protein
LKDSYRAKAQYVLPNNFAHLNVRFLKVRMTAKGTLEVLANVSYLETWCVPIREI